MRKLNVVVTLMLLACMIVGCKSNDGTSVVKCYLTPTQQAEVMNIQNYICLYVQTSSFT